MTKGQPIRPSNIELFLPLQQLFPKLRVRRYFISLALHIICSDIPAQFLFLHQKCNNNRRRPRPSSLTVHKYVGLLQILADILARCSQLGQNAGSDTVGQVDVMVIINFVSHYFFLYVVRDVIGFLHDAEDAADTGIFELFHVAEDAHAAEVEVTFVFVCRGGCDYVVHVDPFLHGSGVLQIIKYTIKNRIKNRAQADKYRDVKRFYMLSLNDNVFNIFFISNLNKLIRDNKQELQGVRRLYL